MNAFGRWRCLPTDDGSYSAGPTLDLEDERIREAMIKMAVITEIADDVFRISTYVPERNLQINQFLVNDDEPLLWHTGQRFLFDGVREAVSKVLDPAKISWIGFSHFEVDECGSLNDWFNLAPKSKGFCSTVGARVNMYEYASRPVKGLGNGQTFATGKHVYRFLATPNLPHCWDAGLLFDETSRTLFCSDLFHHNGDVEPITASEIVGRASNHLVEMEKGSFNDYIPYTSKTERFLSELAELDPGTLAVMHGSSFVGDCAKSLGDLAEVIRKVVGRRQ